MLNNSIQQKQKKILNYLKKYNHFLNNNYEDLYYFNTWSTNCGNFFIKKKFIQIGFIYKIQICFKLFYKKILDEKSEFSFKKNFLLKSTNQKKNLIISYQTNKDQNYDLYFGCKRLSSKDSIWLLINLTDYNLNTKYRSVILKKIFKLNYFKIIFLSIILLPVWLIVKKKSIFQKNFLNSLKKIFLQLPLSKIKNVYLPYESQPFQRFIANHIKRTNKKISITGYVHGGLPSLPAEYYPNKNIDKLIVHSKVEKDILVNIMGWNKKKIKTEKAFRFFKKNSIKEKVIYLPYDFQLNINLYNDLKYLSNKYNLSNFKIANHPAKYKSKKHLILIKILNYFKKKNFSKNKLKLKNSSIFIGVTGSILEGLQNNLSIIHLMNFPEIELYSNKLWKSISNVKIQERIYKYNLLKGRLVNYSRPNSFLRKFNL
jgi:hypothetical protein